MTLAKAFENQYSNFLLSCFLPCEGQIQPLWPYLIYHVTALEYKFCLLVQTIGCSLNLQTINSVSNRMISVCDRVESIMGNGKNVGCKHFLLPKCFQKLCFKVVKTLELCGKELRAHNYLST